MSVFKSGMFVGLFRHSIDEKGRLTIPAAWRPKDLSGEDNVFLALPSMDGYVTVYPPKMIAQLEERISKISLGDSEGQAAIEQLMSKAHSFSCDKQGRINLSDALIGHAKIEKTTVLLGKVATFSIYSEEVYESIQADSAVSREAQAEVLKRFGL